jgi:Family of unknown function (DUF6339)
MLLYPRLPKTVAIHLARDYCSLPVQELYERSSTTHSAAIFAPTGGNRIEVPSLRNLQQQLRDIARQSGYPDALDEKRRREFDARSGQFLHEHMDVTPAEASNQGIWLFMGCVLLPDIVRWRFPGASNGETSLERFLGGNRGVRNTFGRVWWRAHILKQNTAQQPYELLFLLGEDEMVQIMERPNLSGSSMLAIQVCKAFLAATTSRPEIVRSELLRDVMKRLRRLLPLVAFDAIESKILIALVDDIFGEAVHSLERPYVSSSS